MMTDGGAGGAGGDEDTNGGGAGGGGDSGGGDGGAGGGDQGGDGGKAVKWSDHKRALDDLARFKSQAKDAREKAEKAARDLEELKTKLHTEGNDYKSLYETAKSKLEAAETERVQLKQGVVYGERYRAVFPALKEAGLRADAVKLLDMQSLEELEIEATSNGRFIVNGVKDFVEEFKKQYPYAFETKRVRVNGGGAGGDGGTKPKAWTPDTLFKLEQDCKRKGDMAPYFKAIGEYRKTKGAAKGAAS
jgi:hypothetical protein